MQQVAVEKETIETDIGDKEGQEPVYVELGDIRILTPRVREADGSEELLFPQEARLRNITYAAPVFMEMSIIRGGDEEPETVVDSTETKVGRMPIMVGSDKCNIADFSDEVFFRERDLDETLPWEFIHNNVEPAVRENKWTSVRDRVGSDD